MSSFRARLVKSLSLSPPDQPTSSSVFLEDFWQDLGRLEVPFEQVFWLVITVDGQTISIFYFVWWYSMASFQFVHIDLYWRSSLATWHWWFFLEAFFETYLCCFPGFVSTSIAPCFTGRYFGCMLQILLS